MKLREILKPIPKKKDGVPGCDEFNFTSARSKKQKTKKLYLVECRSLDRVVFIYSASKTIKNINTQGSTHFAIN